MCQFMSVVRGDRSRGHFFFKEKKKQRLKIKRFLSKIPNKRVFQTRGRGLQKSWIGPLTPFDAPVLYLSFISIILIYCFN